MIEAEHQDDAQSECACDHMDVEGRIMYGEIIEMALMSGQSFNSERRSLSAILGGVFMCRMHGIKRCHGWQGALWFRFFCLQDVSKGREQDAEALSHLKEMNSPQAKLHLNFFNLNLKK